MLKVKQQVFQVIDDKKECRGYFSDGRLKLKEIPDHLNATWDWSPFVSITLYLREILNTTTTYLMR